MQCLEGNSLALVRADWMKRVLCSRRTFKEMNRTQRAAADSTPAKLRLPHSRHVKSVT